MNNVYNVVYLFTPELDKVLLVFKERGPNVGKLNGVGGGMKNIDSAGCPNIDFIHDVRRSAQREVGEETGAYIGMENLHYLYKEEIPNGELWIFYATIKMDRIHQIEDEQLAWQNINSILYIEPENEKYFAPNTIKHIQDAYVKLGGG